MDVPTTDASSPYSTGGGAVVVRWWDLGSAVDAGGVPTIDGSGRSRVDLKEYFSLITLSGDGTRPAASGDN